MDIDLLMIHKHKMKILIDLTPLSYHISGIERYALCISEKMVKQDLKNEYLLVFRNEIFSSFIDLIDGNRVRATVLYGNNKLLFREITLTRYVNSADADVKLFLAFTSPFFVKRNGVINTIHDVGIWDFPNALDFLHRMYFRIGCMKSVSVSDVILTVSEFSKSRICDVFKIDNQKVQVAYSAPSEKVVSQSNSFEYVKEKYHLPSKYIIHTFVETVYIIYFYHEALIYPISPAICSSSTGKLYNQYPFFFTFQGDMQRICAVLRVINRNFGAMLRCYGLLNRHLLKSQK